MTLKIFTILGVLLLVQGFFTKPVEDDTKSSEAMEITPQQILFVYTATNFVHLRSKYIKQSLNIARKILKDQDVVANDKPEVLEFKRNLTNFLESYNNEQEDNDNDSDAYDVFADIIDQYMEQPEEKQTPDSLFIKDILKKYKINDVKENFQKDFAKFLERFNLLFESSKSHMKKPMLDWYEKFKTLNRFEEKLIALGVFASMV
ncbi:uncharacterized protein ACRADG_005294 [Cochliomyia hominivorax]